jgi:hypothetical protein
MVSSKDIRVDLMKQRAMVILLVLGAAAAGFLSVGLVHAAGGGPDLGGPVVVSPSPGSSLGSGPSDSHTPRPTGDAGESTASTADKSAAKPTPRKTAAEPVKPPSPRPGGGGGGGDDDDDGGGDDDGDGDDD